MEIQCFSRSGYCWCVNEEGQPIPGTSVKYSRPVCRKSSGSGSGNGEGGGRRRRGKKKPGKQRNRSSRPRRNKGTFSSPLIAIWVFIADSRIFAVCTQADRSQFNSDVTNLIMNEYREIHGRIPNGTIHGHKKETVGWKFDQMDVNR